MSGAAIVIFADHRDRRIKSPISDIDEIRARPPNVPVPEIFSFIEKMRATGAQFRFNFVHTNQAQVERALLIVTVRKSYGHDMLPSRLVKESAAVISKPITIYDRLLATQLGEFYSTILLD